MNRLSFILFLLLMLAIGGGVTWYLIDTRNDAFGPAPSAPVTAPEASEGLAIYTNGPYGFSIFYPEASEVSYAFDAGYHVGTAWRTNALPESVGDPLVSIVPYAVKSESSYPRYFNAMVRIGASSDKQEIERCEKPAEAQGETPLPDATINGQVWKAFSFESAGMMQYARGVSYRTVFEERCIAMEMIQTGSIYKEDAPSEADIPDDVLASEYEKLSDIVNSFTFAR